MYLILQPSQKHIYYAAYTVQGELISSEATELLNWSQKNISETFQNEFLSKLRGHGKVITKIGLVLPFGNQEHVEPQIAHTSILKSLSRTFLRQQLLEPSRLIFQETQKLWPHIPHYFLFDSFLSGQLNRQIALPPFPHALTQTYSLQPFLLQSYGHVANIKSLKKDQVAISLCLDEDVSVALLNGTTIEDAILSYSPLSSVMSMVSLGAIDPGVTLEMMERKNVRELTQLILKQTGIQALTETNLSLLQLLQISGLIKRDASVNLDAFSIEALEWIELAAHRFILSLRHAIGSLVTSDRRVNSIIIQSQTIPPTSPLWSLITKGSLEHLRIIPASHSSLEMAVRDLLEKDN